MTDRIPDSAAMPHRLSRRRFLRLLAGVGAAGPLLAACGTGAPVAGPATSAATSGPVTVNQNETPTPGSAEQATAAPAGSAGGTFTFARSSDSDNLDPVTQDGNVDIWIFASTTPGRRSSRRWPRNGRSRRTG